MALYTKAGLWIYTDKKSLIGYDIYQLYIKIHQDSVAQKLVNFNLNSS